MGNRRMLSKNITNSGRFLKMPHESQSLYFHLCMHADDDGVVEGLTIMRMTGANEDNLRVLVAKELIKPLNEDMVAYILDWREHNKLRADRKIDSVYKELLLQVLPEIKLLHAKKRADTKQKTKRRMNEISDVNTGRPLDNQRTVHGRPKLSKVKLSKVNKKEIYKENKSSLTFLTDEVCTELATQYHVSLQAVLETRETLTLYCQANGRGYKDYYAALQNFIRRDLKAGKLQKCTEVRVWSPPYVLEASEQSKLAALRGIKETLSL